MFVVVVLPLAHYCWVFLVLKSLNQDELHPSILICIHKRCRSCDTGLEPDDIRKESLRSSEMVEDIFHVGRVKYL